ncbi:MAG TPA: hypothetical protein VM938_07020 [Acidimicrobiales bacterium]|nr:hypothetical protein [Acidimicrobiales bacterium]
MTVRPWRRLVRPLRAGHTVACHWAEEIAAGAVAPHDPGAA